VNCYSRRKKINLSSGTISLGKRPIFTYENACILPSQNPVFLLLFFGEKYLAIFHLNVVGRRQKGLFLTV
jgi:hypothetical protein